jgi:hypothetical protein
MSVSSSSPLHNLLDYSAAYIYNTGMKQSIRILFGALALILVSCVSAEVQPAPPPEAVVPVEEPEPVPVADEEPSFDPAAVTQEEFDTTMVDVREFIGELNTIVRGRDYEGWVAHLGPSYFARISSPEFLLRVSQSAERLRTRGIVLSSARDYFLQVVVPSRTNDRVDDIEFVGHQRVMAYTLNAKGERLRLYDLENLGNGWRIIN